MLIIYNLFIFFSLNIASSYIIYIKEKKKISLVEFYTIFIWHFIFSIIYFIYVSVFGGDANGYLEYAKNYVEFEKSRPFILGNGSSFIYNLVVFFVNILKLDILNILSIFNFIGFVGLIYFFITLKDITKKISENNFFIKNLPYLIIFIPSLSFWTCGIGKEPFVFLSISLFVYSLNKQKSNYNLLFLSFIILFLVRWQFSIIMLASSLFIFKINKIPEYVKNLNLISLFFVAFIFVNLFTAYFFNFHIFRLEILINDILEKQSYTEGGNLTANFNIDFIQVILNYLFSPIRFSFDNKFYFIAGIENLYILLLISFLIVKFKKKNLKNINLSMLIFIILFLSTIPFATFNLGIAMRQKWAVIVFIIIICVSGLKKYEKE